MAGKGFILFNTCATRCVQITVRSERGDASQRKSTKINKTGAVAKKLVRVSVEKVKKH